MKTPLSRTIPASLVTLLLAASAADEAVVADTHGQTATQVTLVGENYCSGCALKKTHGATAQCRSYGHRHGLRVDRATDAEGKELANLEGRTVSYLENDKSEKLFNGGEFHNARVQIRVRGRFFAAANTVEVIEYAAP